MIRTEYNHKKRRDGLLSCLAFAIAASGLFLSCQLGQPTREAISSATRGIPTREAVSSATRGIDAPIVILSSLYDGGGSTSMDRGKSYSMGCRQALQLSNHSDVSDTLIGFEAAIRYEDADLQVTSEYARAVLTESLASIINNLQFALLSEETPNTISLTDPVEPKYYLSLPMQIESFSTHNIRIQLTFILDGANNSRVIEVPWQFSYGPTELPPSEHTLPPIEVTYSLRFASGLRLTTPSMRCFYIR